MKLYYAPGACSLAPHILLQEAGIPFDLAKVDLKAKQTADGSDYTKINPKGQVPALELDNGELLTENTVVDQYIADQRPDSGLLPPVGTLERYHALTWLSYASTELHKTFGPLFRPNTPDAFKEITKENLAKKFEHMERHLAGGRDYLMGDRFTAGDAYSFVVLSWAKRMHLDLSAYPQLLAYYDRIAARPKVQEALRAEGLA